MTRKMIHLGADSAKIITVPRGVDTALFKPRSSLEINEEARIISTRALRPEPHYDIATIVDAVRIVTSRFSRIEYLVAGDGPRKDHMVQYVAQRGLQGNVRFLGFIEPKRLPEVLQNCQVYVSNVWSDGVSSSLLEAMSCGLFPIVVDNVSNRQWIENGKNGFLVARDKPETLAAAIVAALDDTLLRERAASINRKIVLERASWHANMSRIESAYLQLLKSR